jgi:catechol 2,3-dioxygenase-like lactoylglutathione lyase family enzyme
MTEVLGYHHVSLSVSDLGKSAEWYRQALGFEIDAEIEGDGFRRTRLRAPGSGVTLTLTAHGGSSGEPFDERRAGLDHIAFNVGGADAVEQLKHRFDQLGVDHSEVKQAASGSAMITLRDPDNIQLEVFGGAFDPKIAAGRG